MSTVEQSEVESVEIESTVESTEGDLTPCPDEIRALDPNAEKNWHELLKRTGISMSVDRTRVIDNKSKRAWTIRNLGVLSLVQRLAFAKDEVSRARVWWRETMACAAGDSIPDLSEDNMSVLNPWLSPEMKFRDSRFERLKGQKEARKHEAVLVATGVRFCANTANGKHRLPSESRMNALYCDRACKQEAYRHRAA